MQGPLMKATVLVEDMLNYVREIKCKMKMPFLSICYKRGKK